MLEGKQVVHVKYGNGTIIKESEGHIRICFDETKTEKTFLYPEAFEVFLTFQDEQFQQEAVTLYMQKNEEANKQAQERAEQFRQMDLARKKLRGERLKKARKTAAK